jgi:hypothetical protein
MNSALSGEFSECFKKITLKIAINTPTSESEKNYYFERR